MARHSKSYTVAVVTIGNEVLSGRTADTNFFHLAGGLTDAGAEVVWHASCRDVVDEIGEALRMAMRHARLVILTGGLGPTPDDLTRKVLAQVLERPLVLDDRALAGIRAFFDRRGVKMAPINEVQALLPRGSEVIPNPKGTAPGLLIAHEGLHVMALPGVPWEMEAMLKETVVPWLGERTGGGRITHLVLRTCGIAESALAEKLSEFERTLPGAATLAFLPGVAGVDLRVSFRGSPEEVEGQLSEVRAQLLAAAGDHVFAEGEDTLEAVVGRLLLHQHKTLSAAESCTGGLISERITRVSGSSAWFDRGVVTYSNASKTKLLGVKASVLKTAGAVSPEVAMEMASGMRERAATSIAVSVTGIAGPTGGTDEKPVGLVFMGLDWGEGAVACRFQLAGDRELIRQRASTMALDLVRRHLLGLPIKVLP